MSRGLYANIHAGKRCAKGASKLAPKKKMRKPGSQRSRNLPLTIRRSVSCFRQNGQEEETEDVTHRASLNFNELRRSQTSHFNDLLNRSDITSRGSDYPLHRPRDRSYSTSTSDTSEREEEGLHHHRSDDES